MLWLVLLILWPVAEVFVAIKVADAIGVLLMLVLLVASWPIGSWALRSEGRIVMRRLSAAITSGRPPGREVLDGALVLLGGALLMVPGFITDVLGIALLVPPSRSAARRLIARNLRSRSVTRAVRFGAGGGGADDDVESTAVDIDRPAIDPPHPGPPRFSA